MNETTKDDDVLEVYKRSRTGHLHLHLTSRHSGGDITPHQQQPDDTQAQAAVLAKWKSESQFDS